VGFAGGFECVAASSASARLVNPPTAVAGEAEFATAVGGCGSADLLGAGGWLAAGDAGTIGFLVAAGAESGLASEGAGLMVVIGGAGCLGERFLAITGLALGVHVFACAKSKLAIPTQEPNQKMPLPPKMFRTVAILEMNCTTGWHNLLIACD